MKEVLLRLVHRLRPSQPSRALGVITCAASANALIAFEQQLNHVVTGAISDCVGAQVLQSMPLFARMSSGGLDPGSIATQIAMAFIGSALLTIFPDILSKFRARPQSRFRCLAWPLSKSGAEYPKED